MESNCITRRLKRRKLVRVARQERFPVILGSFLTLRFYRQEGYRTLHRVTRDSESIWECLVYREFTFTTLEELAHSRIVCEDSLSGRASV